MRNYCQLFVWSRSIKLIFKDFLISYRISANSFQGNYSLLNLTLCTVTFDHSIYRHGNYSREETIQGRKLLAEIRYIIISKWQCKPSNSSNPSHPAHSVHPTSTLLYHRGRNHRYSFHPLFGPHWGHYGCQKIQKIFLTNRSVRLLPFSQNWMNFKQPPEIIKNDWFLIEFHSFWNFGWVFER